MALDDQAEAGQPRTTLAGARVAAACTHVHARVAREAGGVVVVLLLLLCLHARVAREAGGVEVGQDAWNARFEKAGHAAGKGSDVYKAEL